LALIDSDKAKRALTLITSEMPLLEDTLTRLLLIGLTRPNRLSQLQTLQIMDALVRRACVLCRSYLDHGITCKTMINDATSPLLILNGELLDAILRLTLYRVCILLYHCIPHPHDKSFVSWGHG
jgi:hypothetical protein